MDDKPFDHQNAAYAQALFEEYARNPESVPAEWREFFSRGSGAALDAGLLLPESLTNGHPGTTARGSRSPGHRGGGRR